MMQKRVRKLVRSVLQPFRSRPPASGRSLGDERRAAGDWAMAARHYRAHVDGHPDDFAIWVQLGHALKEAGRLEDADEAYRKATRLRPEDADLLLSRGHLAKKRGDATGAIDLYRQSFIIDGNPGAAGELGQNALSVRPARVETETSAGTLDRFSEGMIAGWAVNRKDPQRLAEVELLVDGVVIATGVADIERPDVTADGATRGPAGFLIDLSGLIDFSKPTEVHARLKNDQTPLGGSPITIRTPEINRRWARRWNRGAKMRRHLAPVIATNDAREQVSIILLAGRDGAPSAALTRSLKRQIDSNWELLVVRLDAIAAPKQAPQAVGLATDEFSLDPKTVETDAYARFGDAVRRARGSHVLVLGEGSTLEPECVWRIRDAARRGADLVYWDEARVGRVVHDVERFILRPAFSFDHVGFSSAVIGSFAIERTAAIKGWEDLGMPDIPDFERFSLASIRHARIAAHIPCVLERRPARLADPAQIQAPVAAKRQRRSGDRQGGTLVMVLADTDLDSLRLSVHSLRKSGLREKDGLAVLTREERSGPLARYADRLQGAARIVTVSSDVPFAFAVNDAVKSWAHGYENLVLLESGVRPAGSWLEPLLELLSKTDVGIAAPVILDSADAVTSAGLLLFPDHMVHGHQGSPRTPRPSRTHLWDRSLVSTTVQSAAYGCLAMRAHGFLEAGGLDPAMSRATVMADLCLRIGLTGRRTMVRPGINAVGPRLSRRIALDPAFKARWSAYIAAGDPHHHPGLDENFGLQTLDTQFCPARLTRVITAQRPWSEARLYPLEVALPELAR